jgi:hypothetical protein
MDAENLGSPGAKPFRTRRGIMIGIAVAFVVLVSSFLYFVLNTSRTNLNWELVSRSNTHIRDGEGEDITMRVSNHSIWPIFYVRANDGFAFGLERRIKTGRVSEQQGKMGGGWEKLNLGESVDIDFTNFEFDKENMGIKIKTWYGTIDQVFFQGELNAPKS